MPPWNPFFAGLSQTCSGGEGGGRVIIYPWFMVLSSPAATLKLFPFLLPLPPLRLYVYVRWWYNPISLLFSAFLSTRPHKPKGRNSTILAWGFLIKRGGSRKTIFGFKKVHSAGCTVYHRFSIVLQSVCVCGGGFWRIAWKGRHLFLNLLSSSSPLG